MAQTIDLHLNQRLIAEQEQQQAFVNLVKTAPTSPPTDTLLNYADTHVIAMRDRKGAFRPVKTRTDDEIIPVQEVVSVYRDLRENFKHSQECNSKGPTSDEIRGTLEKAFPPLLWRSDDKIFRRLVSTKAATPSDVVQLQEKLDALLEGDDIKPTGLCETRRRHFDQLFDELARQEILKCFPRGLLLLRIRDEIRLSLQAYESLYLSNAAYGVRKAMKTEMERQKLENELQSLTDERKDLLEKIRNVRLMLQEQGEKFRVTSAHVKKMFSEERDNLKRQNHNLKSQLETLVTGHKPLN